MQSRHTDRERYFRELVETSRAYYIDYVQKHKSIGRGVRILEIGCGEGGNLLPFAALHATVVGVDITPERIEQARYFFNQSGVNGTFLCVDFLKMEPPAQEERFDIVLIHDVIEHIEPQWKEDFIARIRLFLKEDGIIFFGFPAWQMPFGGHQQICRSAIASKLPFTHLLPKGLYKSYLSLLGESQPCIEELLSIKRSKMTIEHFERLCKKLHYKIANRTLWFINPHYKVKFRLPVMRLACPLTHVYYLRNYLSTSCFYILRPLEEKV